MGRDAAGIDSKTLKTSFEYTDSESCWREPNRHDGVYNVQTFIRVFGPQNNHRSCAVVPNSLRGTVYFHPGRVLQRLNRPWSAPEGGIEPARHPPHRTSSANSLSSLAATMQFSLATSLIALAAFVGSVVGETHTVHFDNR